MHLTLAILVWITDMKVSFFFSPYLNYGNTVHWNVGFPEYNTTLVDFIQYCELASQRWRKLASGYVLSV